MDASAELSPSSRRRAVHRGGRAPHRPDTWVVSTSSARSMGGRYRGSFAWGGWAITSSTAARSSSSPSPRPAAVPTTGTPSRRESSARSTEIPFRSASSRRLTHTTVRLWSSRVWRTRFRLRSSPVASHTTTAASAPPKQRKSRAASSSAERARRE